MEFSTLIRERYSVRSFSGRPVSREQIEALLEEVRQAPTAVNFQPQRYLVLTTPENMAKLAEATKYTFHARRPSLSASTRPRPGPAATTAKIRP